MEQIILKHIKKIDINIPNMMKYFSSIDKNNTPSEKMKKIYTISKIITPRFYIGNTIHSSYNYLKEGIIACEHKIPQEFILDSNPLYIPPKINNRVESKDEVILNEIVYKTRKYLVSKHQTSSNSVDINSLDFINKCTEASEIVHIICKSKGIQDYITPIFPGYSKEDKIFNGNGFHFFNIVYLNEKFYIIDCTYRQFFTLKGNFLERIGVLHLSGCKPGTFMMMTESRKKVASKILKDGWIELTESVLKDYLDGFTLSYRNGHYYEQTNDYSFNTSYTSEDYKYFLFRLDNQVNHEGKKVLGYQRYPTRIPILFSKNDL